MIAKGLGEAADTKPTSLGAVTRSYAMKLSRGASRGQERDDLRPFSVERLLIFMRALQGEGTSAVHAGGDRQGVRAEASL